MLLPSALPCDPSQTPPLTRLQSALFASPPASPPQLSTQTAIGSIFSTCRSLQSLLANPAPPPNAGQEPITPPASSHAQLPTPPLAHAPAPLKLRLRSRKTDTTTTTPKGDHGPARKRIVKRTASVAQQQQQPPRGANKRRRAADDDDGDMGRYNSNNEDDDSDMAQQQQQQQQQPLDNPFDRGQDKENEPQPPSAPHTPKRSRIAPEVLPLGLERADYHHLHSGSSSNSDCRVGPASAAAAAELEPGTDVEVDADGATTTTTTWSTEEDRILVELVLEKLKLTKSDWQDCARSLGKDRGSVGRRWKSLMVHGDVGLKMRGGVGGAAAQRRGRIHGTWR
ncbi:hypothetical protein C8A00DRAFT_33214 [Chaetomidium leptoderma]|uniref:Myb-like domain-containing protein n=1 Tax=Chaetomidium leptoderma TaxID=669021 RepID=A0AAN6VLZ1_9PEZI|nr:hypothetical protein C8A00DRAFT_33214 [Chaetomidium leptoderma]